MFKAELDWSETTTDHSMAYTDHCECEILNEILSGVDPYVVTFITPCSDITPGAGTQ